MHRRQRRVGRPHRSALLIVLAERQRVEEFLEIGEFVRDVGKSCFPYREWCRLGRIRAEKKLPRRGTYAR
jgi:hypothetical protein